MAYIDRDKLIERLVNTPSKCCQLPQTIPFLNGSAARQNEIIDLIEAEPAEDVRENVHGEWIDTYDFWQCSVCKSTRLKQARSVYGDTFFITLKTNFCPDCGADMRGEKDV